MILIVEGQRFHFSRRKYAEEFMREVNMHTEALVNLKELRPELKDLERKEIAEFLYKKLYEGVLDDSCD